VNANIFRSYVGDVTVDADGRTIEGVIVPYDQPAEVADDYGPAPVYREVFTATSFARQLQGIAARPDLLRGIALKLDHRDELERHIGWTRAVESTETGLVGRFGLHARADIDLIRSMLADSHKGLSLEARLLKSRVRPDGVVERRVVELVNVAAVPAGAYVGAGITAMRAADDVDRPTPQLDSIRDAWGFTD
jgi:HK97 family phage prohead protease